MSREPALSHERLVPRTKPAFRQIAATGFRTLSAAWLAPVLLFVILAPQGTGACAEILVLRASGRQLPPELIALAIIGHASFLWWPVVIFGLPWVIGGAAARFRDELNPPEHPRSFVEQANSFYGRVFALLIPFGLLLAALVVLLYVLPLWLMVRDRLFTTERPAVFLASMTSHPAMIASTVVCWLAASVAILAWDLIVAAMAVEELDLFRATGRGLSFVREHRADTARLWLLVMLTGLPGVLLPQAIFHVTPSAISLAAIALGSAGYGACAFLLGLAVAASLSLARRPVITAG